MPSESAFVESEPVYQVLEIRHGGPPRWPSQHITKTINVKNPPRKQHPLSDVSPDSPAADLTSSDSTDISRVCRISAQIMVG